MATPALPVPSAVRRARRERSLARAVLAVQRARDVLSKHHGGGGMPPREYQDGPLRRLPYWKCRCGEDANFAPRAYCRTCGDLAPFRVLNKHGATPVGKDAGKRSLSTARRGRAFEGPSASPGSRGRAGSKKGRKDPQAREPSRASARGRSARARSSSRSHRRGGAKADGGTEPRGGAQTQP